MARIYVETTVISFYFNARTEPEMVARENWSRRWLDGALAGTDELVTSLAVKSELDAGEFPNKADMLALASRIPLLALNDAIAEVVDSYISHHVMPNNPGGDAFTLLWHRSTVATSW